MPKNAIFLIFDGLYFTFFWTFFKNVHFCKMSQKCVLERFILVKDDQNDFLNFGTILGQNSKMTIFDNFG